MDAVMDTSAKPTILRHVRIAVMSDRLSEKSSAADIILGREASPQNSVSHQHVKRQGEVAGRQVDLVDVQAWRYFDSFIQKKTPQMFRQEMMRGVFSCTPNAFLLVVHDDVILSECMRDALFDHVTALGEDAWHYSIVLLMVREQPSGGAGLGVGAQGGASSELRGEMLQSLVEKCGGRYHVFHYGAGNNNVSAAEVRELLEKVEKMVVGNEGRHFELDRGLWESKEEEMRVHSQRAQERQRAVQIQRQAWQQLRGDTTLSAVSILLLGAKGSGKSSSGNTILGREEFEPGKRNAVCVRRQGEVAGRRVTVVEVPGWPGCCPPECSSEAINQQVAAGPNLCDRGKPHAYLLLLPLDEGFGSAFCRSLEGMMDYLHESAWSRAIVLFTCGDWLGDTTVEQFIESEGETLRGLVDKCGNRYHVFNNFSQSDEQVTELLEKIEEMLTVRGDLQYEVDLGLMRGVVEDWGDENPRAEEVTIQAVQKREARDTASITRLSDMRLMLMGFGKSGKSSTANTILGRQAFELCSHSSGVTAQGEVAGRRISIVEPPNASSSNANLFETRRLLIDCLTTPGPHALLLTVPVETGFDELSRQVTEEYVEVLGEQVWEHMIVVFTFGDWLGDTTTIEEHITREGDALKWLVEKCGNRYQLINNKIRKNSVGVGEDGSACDEQVLQLLEKVERMVTEKGGATFKCDPTTLDRWGE